MCLSLLIHRNYFYLSPFSPSSCSTVLSLTAPVHGKQFKLHDHFATDAQVPSIQGGILWEEHLSKFIIKTLEVLIWSESISYLQALLSH